MRQMFVARVKEKEAELKEAEKEVTSLRSSFRLLYINSAVDISVAQ